MSEDLSQLNAVTRAFVADARRLLETKPVDERRLRAHLQRILQDGLVLHQSLSAHASLFVDELPLGRKTHASRTGLAHIDAGPAVSITVSMSDYANGAQLPVGVEWPLARFRFRSFLDVKLDFMSFGQFSHIPPDVKALVEACLIDLEMPHVRPY